METKRYSVRVIFEGGDYLETEINGTPESIQEYYDKGKLFNIGNGGNDRIAAIKDIRFLNVLS